MPPPSTSGFSAAAPSGRCHHIKTPTSTSKLALYEDLTFYCTMHVSIVTQTEITTTVTTYVSGTYGFDEDGVVLKGAATVETVKVLSEGDITDSAETKTLETKIDLGPESGWTFGEWNKEECSDSE